MRCANPAVSLQPLHVLHESSSQTTAHACTARSSLILFQPTHPLRMSWLYCAGLMRAMGPACSYHAAVATAIQVHEVGAPTLTWSASGPGTHNMHTNIFTAVQRAQTRCAVTGHV
eukprot:758868-Pelagomonas_calceolata.AAC.6